MNTAISSAISGVGSSIHTPVDTVVTAKGVNSAGRLDKMIMLIESVGLYRFDAESTAVSNDTTIIRPTDVASDAAAGRWLKMSSILTDHSLLNNILGNGEYHLSLTERDKLTGIAVGANNYVHPNHTGDVTSVGGGATTIVASAVTNSKLANMAANTVKGSVAGGAPIDLTASQLKTILALSTSDISGFAVAALAAAPAETVGTLGSLLGSSAVSSIADTDYVNFLTGTTIKKFLWSSLYGAVFSKVSGDVTIGSTGVSAIGSSKVVTSMIADNNVTLSKIEDIATASFLGRTTAGTGNTEVLTTSQAKTLLGLNTNNLSQRSYRVSPTGTINGANTDFTISALVLSGTEEVYMDGILMNAGAGNDYTIVYGATTTITFIGSSIPVTGNVILVNYSV